MANLSNCLSRRVYKEKLSACLNARQRMSETCLETAFFNGVSGGSIFGDFSGHADGECRGLGRIGGGHRKRPGETRLWVPSDRRGSPAFARRHAPKHREKKMQVPLVSAIVRLLSESHTWFESKLDAERHLFLAKPIFGKNFRRMPTANAEGRGRSRRAASGRSRARGRVGGSPFGSADGSPRRPPSACPEMSREETSVRSRSGHPRRGATPHPHGRARASSRRGPGTCIFFS